MANVPTYYYPSGTLSPDTLVTRKMEKAHAEPTLIYA